MKREFKAEMQVVRFGAEDVIATSGKVVTLSKFNDGDTTNNTFSFGGNSYAFVDNDGFKSFRGALASYVGDEEMNRTDSEHILFGGKSVGVIFNKDVSGFDGEYTYAGSASSDGSKFFTFSKKQ